MEIDSMHEIKKICQIPERTIFNFKKLFCLCNQEGGDNGDKVTKFKELSGDNLEIKQGRSSVTHNQFIPVPREI